MIENKAKAYSSEAQGNGSGSHVLNLHAKADRLAHPLYKFLGGVGFRIACVVVAIGVMVVTFLTSFGVQIHRASAIVAFAALMVLGYAVSFAFAGWPARFGR